MNSRTEIFDAFDGKTESLSPPAVFTQTGTEGQMGSSGASWPEANYDPEKMAALSLEFSRKFGFAVARIPFCVTVLPEALGCETAEGNASSQPMVTGSPYRELMDYSEVPEFPSVSEVLTLKRIPCVISAAEKIKKNHEDLFLVCGFEDAGENVQQLLGAEQYLMQSLMDPDSVAKWVSAMQPYVEGYSKALSEYADDVQMIAGAAMDITSPEMFNDYTVPFDRKTLSNIRGCKKTVHCCGDTLPVLEELASLGEDGLSVETSADPEGISSIVLKHTRLIGGISPVTVMFGGTPSQIRADARKASDLGYSIIAPECGVPPQTSDENLEALSRYRD